MSVVSPSSRVGAVVIGRNEGDRLIRCLQSLIGTTDLIVYVDSGSTDNSVDNARKAGVEVVCLDQDQPFTAARARNHGLMALNAIARPAYVQFIDGDCELARGWIASASAFLDSHPLAAVVCGRRRERFPDRSVYNRLCDQEWNTRIGVAKACGGDALIRSAALGDVGGYNPTMIAGEEPEMCVRIRANGWEVWRLDLEMTLHDAAILRFSQWWQRTRRGGYAAAAGMAMHGGHPEYLGVGTVLRAVTWGLALPLAILISTSVLSGWAVALLFAYPIQILRVALRDGGAARAWERATFLTIGKFAELIGVADYTVQRWAGSSPKLIEYK